MRMPSARFTVRRLMTAVAVVGLLLGCEAMRRRWEFNRAMVAYHANEERRMLRLLTGGFILERDKTGKRRRVEIGRNIERAEVQQRWLYHSMMGARYQRVARFPWLSIKSDPPLRPVAR
jgi:hypothetical protein